MEAFRVWSDGISPIIFTSFDGVNKISPEQVSDRILEFGKELTKKFKRVFIVVNCSLLEFSHENIDFIKAIKSSLTQTFIESIAIIMPCKKKFNINLSDEGSVSVKSCDCFEEALGYINHQMQERELL